MVKTWVSHSGKQTDKIVELEAEIESMEKKERELRAEIESLHQSIFEKQNRLRELQDEEAKQNLLD
jgi:peptidoglycan hydrolase CwlO-like protein